MNENWDKWNKQTKHDSYQLHNTIYNQTILICADHEHIDDNPFAFGAKVTNRGISIWRLKIEAYGAIHWIA